MSYPLCVLLLFAFFFADTDRRIQTLTTIAGPGMLSLVNQSLTSADQNAAAVSKYFSPGSLQHTSIKRSSKNRPYLRWRAKFQVYAPSPGWSERKKSSCIFFLIGENIEGNEDILQQMRRDGHLIGNHTWDHVQLNKIPTQKVRMEIEKTNNRIYEATGVYPSYVRPSTLVSWLKIMELSITIASVSGMLIHWTGRARI